MPHASFVPLRIFSCYTMLEGAIDPKDIATKARDMGFPAAAICDRNGLYGAMPFSDSICIKSRRAARLSPKTWFGGLKTI